MPERRNVVTSLTELIFGGPWIWDGRYGEIHERETERSGFTTADYDAARQMADDVYLLVLDRIDWNRTILDAQGLHAKRLTLPADHEWALSEEICPVCLHDALASSQHTPRGEPETPLAQAQRTERLSRLRTWAKGARGWKVLPEILASPVHDKRFLAENLLKEANDA